MTGRLWLQLAFVALADSEAAHDALDTREAARPRALADRLAYRAATCGVVGGSDLAFSTEGGL